MKKKGMKQSAKLSIDLITTIIATLIAGAVTVAAVISMAWFASNKDVTGTGMSITVPGERYSIVLLDEDEKDIDLHQSAIEDAGTRIIGITEAFNLNNYNSGEHGKGILPGSSGTIEFFVKPLVDEDVTLTFTFEVIGYKKENNELTAYEADEEPGIFLNGHILLFTTLNGNKTAIFNRPDNLYTRSFVKTFNGKNTSIPVDVDWLWPVTLSSVMSITGKTPIIDGDTLEAVTQDILSHNNFYFKDFDGSTTLLEVDKQYERFGDYYNKADNEIGRNIDYLILRMIVTEAENQTGGGGE